MSSEGLPIRPPADGFVMSPHGHQGEDSATPGRLTEILLGLTLPGNALVLLWNVSEVYPPTRGTRSETFASVRAINRRVRRKIPVESDLDQLRPSHR